MNTILALDLGTRMGWAIRRGNGDFHHGVENLSPNKHFPRAYRFATFQAFLEMHRVDAVVYEDIKRHAGTAAAHMWGGFEAILLAHCLRNGIETAWLGVGEIKKHATGKGDAGKDAVIAAMRARGFEPTDDNDADALALLFAYLEREEE